MSLKIALRIKSCNLFVEPSFSLIFSRLLIAAWVWLKYTCRDFNFKKRKKGKNMM